MSLTNNFERNEPEIEPGGTPERLNITIFVNNFQHLALTETIE